MHRSSFILASLAEARADALLVTALDEVAWLLNLRGGDVPHNPIFVSYALLTRDAATLYVAASKVRHAPLVRLCEVYRNREAWVAAGS